MQKQTRLRVFLGLALGTSLMCGLASAKATLLKSNAHIYLVDPTTKVSIEVKRSSAWFRYIPNRTSVQYQQGTVVLHLDELVLQFRLEERLALLEFKRGSDKLHQILADVLEKRLEPIKNKKSVVIDLDALERVVHHYDNAPNTYTFEYQDNCFDKNSGEPLQNRSPIISKYTELVVSPELFAEGIEVKTTQLKYKLAINQQKMDVAENDAAVAEAIENERKQLHNKISENNLILDVLRRAQ